MFPCNFKIPGHSGTDFKHRKAFQKTKERLKRKIRTDSSLKKSQPTTSRRNTIPYSKTNVSKPLKWMVAITRLSMFLLVFLLAKNIACSVYADMTTNSYKGIKAHVHYKNGLTYMERYRLLIKEGNECLKADQLDEAQQKFTKAWDLDRYGFEVNLGMTKTLLKKCKRNGEYCREAKAFFNFMKKNAKLSDIELNDIEKLYVSK